MIKKVQGPKSKVQRLSLNVLFLTLGFGLWTLDAYSTVFYVATTGGGSACTTGSPCSSIATAAGLATQPDDVIELRDGTYDQCSVTLASGTSGHPIVIRSANDLGAVWKCTTNGASNLQGPLYLPNKSYITIGTPGHGIDFNGSTSEGMIYLLADSANVVGITVQNNTIRNNGNLGCMSTNGGMTTCSNAANAARQIYFNNVGSFSFSTINLINNTWSGNYGVALWIRGVSNSTISGNNDSGRKSSQANASNGFNWLSRFMHFGNGSNNNIITNNIIENWTKDSIANHCPTGWANCNYSPNPIRSDVDSDNNTISSNIIRNINSARGSTNSQAGIEVESGCDNNIISYNRLSYLGGVGIQLGSYQTNIASGNIVEWNSMYDCGCGVIASNAQNYTVKNNIFHAGSSTLAAAIQSDKATVGDVWKNNNWYNPNTSNIGLTGATSGSCVAGNKTRAVWAGAVGETNSIGADPTYVNTTSGSENLNLNAGSPSIHAADDGSNQGFAPLADPPPTATIALNFPNGGEDLMVGTTIPIIWTTAQTGNCKVELIRYPGITPELLSSSTTCTNQTFNWLVTPPGGVALGDFKVTSLLNGTVTDDSDGPVKIHGNFLLLKP